MNRVQVLAFVTIVAMLILLVPFGATGQGGGSPAEEATIWGHVYDASTDFIPNLTISLEREYYIGNSTITDSNGYYLINLPSGTFILKIYNEMGLIINQLDFNITNGETKRLDIQVDINAAQSHVYGSIRHKWTLSPMSGADVFLYRKGKTTSGPEATTATDNEGRFTAMVPAGDYEISVEDDGTVFYSKYFTLNFSEEKKFDLSLEAPSAMLNPNNVLRILQEKYIQIILMIITIIVSLILLAYIDRIFNLAYEAVKKKPRKFIDKSIIQFSERVVKWFIVILMMIVLAFLVAQILDIVSTLWIPVRNSMASIFTIMLLVFFMRISLMIWRQFIAYMKGDHRHEKPKKILSARMVTFIEIIGKYVIAFVFALVILLTALAALGMSDLIVGGFVDGLISNAGFIIFTVTLLVISYVSVKFMTSFFEDMKGKTTRFRPEMIEVASKGVKYFIYAIIGMIMAFTVLSAAGLGEIGQTLILVFSMILGLVVSMAATGSIGNMLSGLVIMSFKPFDEGDWVTIADKYQGQIVETNLMFTKLKDLEDELIEIPNNIILAKGIINWTTAAKSGGFAVEIDTTIGYNIPAQQVIDLMVKSCDGVKGLMKTKEPFVVMTDFMDHAIGYKLRAYIDTPHHRYRIKTLIMINMQRTFTEAGVEILSPIYEIGRLERTPSPKEVKDRMKKVRSYE